VIGDQTEMRYFQDGGSESFHEGVDFDPLGVDGGLQLSGLAHGFVSGVSEIGQSVKNFFFLLQGEREVRKTYLADCNSMTSICA